MTLFRTGKPESDERERARRAKEERARRKGERGPSRLTAEQAATLAQMRADNLAAPTPFRASEYWIGLNERFDRWFHDEGIADVEDQPYNRLFSGGDPRSGKYYDYALWMLYREVCERDASHGMLERVSATASTHAKTGAREFEGRRVSWDLLISVDTLCSVAELLPGLLSEPVVLADLGAGYGRIGHVLRAVNPRAAYLAVDLPEALLVASAYLPRLLPGAPVHPYAEVRATAELTRERLLDGGGVWFCGAHDLARFADDAVDAFVNVASFQEMTAAQVADYLALADRITGRAVYLQELWDAHRHGLEDLAIGGLDDYAFPAAWERRFLRNATFSEKVFEAGFVC